MRPVRTAVSEEAIGLSGSNECTSFVERVGTSKRVDHCVL